MESHGAQKEPYRNLPESFGDLIGIYDNRIGILWDSTRIPKESYSDLQESYGNPVGIYKHIWESCMNLQESYGNPIFIYKNLSAILKKFTKI